MELNNCISKLNSAMKDLQSAMDEGTISLLMNRKEMGVKDMKVALLFQEEHNVSYFLVLR